jgi:hypothetical protein
MITWQLEKCTVPTVRPATRIFFFRKKSIMDVTDMTNTNMTATNIKTQAEARPLFMNTQEQILNFICFGNCDVTFVI